MRTRCMLKWRDVTEISAENIYIYLLDAATERSASNGGTLVRSKPMNARSTLITFDLHVVVVVFIL